MLQVGLMPLADLVMLGWGPGKNWQLHPAREPAESPARTGSSSPAFPGSRVCAASHLLRTPACALPPRERSPAYAHPHVLGPPSGPATKAAGSSEGGRVGTHAPCDPEQVSSQRDAVGIRHMWKRKERAPDSGRVPRPDTEYADHGRLRCRLPAGARRVVLTPLPSHLFLPGPQPM